MARNWMEENTALKKRVDKHDEQIDELLLMSTADHKTLELHGRELRLLHQLSKVQSERITLVHAIAKRQIARSRRRTGQRRQKK